MLFARPALESKKIDDKKGIIHYGILHSPAYAFFEKAYIVEMNAIVVGQSVACPNKSAAKIQDEQSVNYFWLAIKDAYF